ncbi:MAG: PD-(D/E)XK nuclease family protein [Acidimicrobiia bacterium]|nr:PD-(D/E)XK nuclease family protein [bacterium]MXZ67696.1 PD-(D/E)XK nuclease family protein [Acidimicrobiia bacterium]MYB44806.1 PD-(D/E)XK nuclease family protein [Acidimicrobiia bacterium]MYC84262.1 PD-(D/E)XK nuclease family protein [Acidimicrobiia bacterium]
MSSVKPAARQPALFDNVPGPASPAGGTGTADGSRTALETISPSRAGDFKQCPLLFRFRAIDRLPEPVTAPQARGTTAHLALERLFDLTAAERTPERLFDLFREEWTALRATAEYSGLFDDLDAERQWGIDSLRVVANYTGLEDPTTVAPIERELMLTEDLGEIVVRGILDRMDERPDGELVIIDYKTGAAPPERYALPAFFALKIYALLVQRQRGRTPAELRLMYLGNSTVYSIEIDRNTLEGIERQLLALTATIRAAVESDNFPPKPSALCRWCAFQDLCPEGQAYARPEPALPLDQ